LEWHQPREVYQSRHAPLVGEQAATLPGFAETSGQLRAVLGMPDQPQVALVLSHLLALSSATPPRPIDPSVYEFLGSRWHDLEPTKQSALTERPVVWDGARYWHGRYAFLSDKSERLFGLRRGYLRRMLSANAQLFLNKVGVRREPEFADFVDVLVEIAESAGSSRSDDEHQRVLRIFEELDRLADGLTLTDSEVSQFRAKCIFLTYDNRFVAADLRDGARVMLPESGFRHSIPQELLGRDSVLHPALIRAGGGAFLQLLEIASLSPYAAIASNLTARYPHLSDGEKLRVLEFVLDVWRDSSDSERTDLSTILVQVPLIRCHDDQYRRGCEVYFATAELDTIFGTGYVQPHAACEVRSNEQRGSRWYWLFSDVGVRERPSAQGIVQAVRALEGVAPLEQRRRSAQAIYNLLNSEVGQGREYGDGTELRPLIELAWLPERNGGGWYCPRDLYQARYANVIGLQGPVLPFAETSSALRDLLQMPAEPPIECVVRHVLSTARPISNFAYEELGRRWHEVEEEISTEVQSRLCNEPVIWDEARQCHWSASEAFYDDLSDYFGPYRCYLKPPAGAIQTFFEHIGVNRYDRRCSHLSFLLEVARNELSDTVLDGELRTLLLRNFDHLGRQGSEDVTYEAEQSLRDLPLIPGRDGLLHRPDRIVLDESSHGDIERLFKDAAIPIVDGDKRDGIGLTPAAERYLRETLRVPYLSEVVRRSLADAVGSQPDSALQDQLRALVPSFWRVQRFMRRNSGDSSVSDTTSPDDLRQIRLLMCSQVLVEYAFPVEWGVPPELIDTTYFYQDAPPTLHIKSSQQWRSLCRNIAMALAHALFCGHEAITIGMLLEQETLEDAERYLDDYDYPPQLDGTIDVPSSSTVPQSMLNDDDHGFASDALGGDETVEIEGGNDREEAHVQFGGAGRFDQGFDHEDYTKQGSDHQAPVQDEHDSMSDADEEELDPYDEDTHEEEEEDKARSRYGRWTPDIEPDRVPPQVYAYITTIAENFDDSTDNPEGERQAPQGGSRSTADLTHAEKKDVGRWGEHHVLSYLRGLYTKQYAGNIQPLGEAGFAITIQGQVVVRVQLLNEGRDVGKGHDILIDEEGKRIYVEVKSTITASNDWFKVSRAQWRFAAQHKHRFVLYCVHSAGLPSAIITEVWDLHDRWQRGEIEGHPIEIRL